MKRCHPNVSAKERTRFHEEEGNSGSETMITEKMPSSRGLRDELERLRDIRDEIDSDIRALEKAMLILRDSSF